MSMIAVVQLRLNLLVTYEKNFAKSKKTQEQSYGLEFVSYNSMSS